MFVQAFNLARKLFFSNIEKKWIRRKGHMHTIPLVANASKLRTVSTVLVAGVPVNSDGYAIFVGLFFCLYAGGSHNRRRGLPHGSL